MRTVQHAHSSSKQHSLYRLHKLCAKKTFWNVASYFSLIFLCCHLHIYKKRAIFILYSPATSILLTEFLLKRKLSRGILSKIKSTRNTNICNTTDKSIVYLVKEVRDHRGTEPYIFYTYILLSHQFSLLLHPPNSTKLLCHLEKVLPSWWFLRTMKTATGEYSGWW